MNVTVCHSHQTRCGILEYGSQLDRSLIDLGARVQKCSYAYLGEVVAKMKRGSTFLVHFEPGLVTPWYLNTYLDEAHKLGAKTVLCCHWYEREAMLPYDGHVDCFVLHRDYPMKHPNSVIIPLGCPVYAPEASRADLRARFGLPTNKNTTVLTTIGFLTPWKVIPAITQAMLDAIADNPNLHIRVHTPWPFDHAGVPEQERHVREVLAAHACKSVSFSTDFLPERDALDLVHASDLGFVFHPFHTHSVSAATKQFVSARRPLVVTGSTHTSDLRGGVIRVDTFDASMFARTVAAVASNRETTGKLQKEIEKEYERLNMAVVAKQYLDLFEKLHRERAVDR